MLRKQSVYIIFGQHPWDFDSWLQARLSDEKANQEARWVVPCNTFLSLLQRSSDTRGIKLVNASFISIFPAEQSCCWSSWHIKHLKCVHFLFLLSPCILCLSFPQFYATAPYGKNLVQLSCKLCSKVLKWYCVLSKSAPDVNRTKGWEVEVKIGPIYFEDLCCFWICTSSLKTFDLLAMNQVEHVQYMPRSIYHFWLEYRESRKHYNWGLKPSLEVITPLHPS